MSVNQANFGVRHPSRTATLSTMLNPLQMTALTSGKDACTHEIRGMLLAARLRRLPSRFANLLLHHTAR